MAVLVASTQGKVFSVTVCCRPRSVLGFPPDEVVINEISAAVNRFAPLVSVDFSPRSLYIVFACKTMHWQGSSWVE